MPLPTVVSFGSVTMTVPSASTDAYNFFALSTPDSGVSQVLDRWRYLGHNGTNLKKMGTSGRSGTIIGWIDASSAANLATAEGILNTKVDACASETFTFAGTGPTVTAAVTGVAYPRRWLHDGRYCSDFVVTWEATQ